jgi:hypothetical protein
MSNYVKEFKQVMSHIKDLVEDTLQELDRQETDVDAIKELVNDFLTSNLEELVNLQNAKIKLP